MITGESKPVSKKTGGKGIGGAIDGEGSVTIEVEKTGNESFLSGCIAPERNGNSGNDAQ